MTTVGTPMQPASRATNPPAAAQWLMYPENEEYRESYEYTQFSRRGHYRLGRISRVRAACHRHCSLSKKKMYGHGHEGLRSTQRFECCGWSAALASTFAWSYGDIRMTAVDVWPGSGWFGLWLFLGLAGVAGPGCWGGVRGERTGMAVNPGRVVISASVQAASILGMWRRAACTIRPAAVRVGGGVRLGS
jgi:hypothetical protein